MTALIAILKYNRFLYQKTFTHYNEPVGWSRLVLLLRRFLALLTGMDDVADCLLRQRKSREAAALCAGDTAAMGCSSCTTDTLTAAAGVKD